MDYLWKRQLPSLLQFFQRQVGVEGKRGQHETHQCWDGISCPLPWTSEQWENSESSCLAAFQRQIEICVFIQDFLSCRHAYTRDSNLLGHTQTRKTCGIKNTWKAAESAESSGSTLLWGCSSTICMRGSCRRSGGCHWLVWGAGCLILCNPDALAWAAEH